MINKLNQEENWHIVDTTEEKVTGLFNQTTNIINDKDKDNSDNINNNDNDSGNYNNTNGNDTNDSTNDDNVNINHNDNIIPNLSLPSIYCDVSNKKYNLFDKYSYIQFIQFTITAKLKRIDINANRFQTARNNLICQFLKDTLNLQISENNKFLIDNELTLYKLKNKRQLLLFLHKKFSKLHDLNNHKSYKKITSNILSNPNTSISFTLHILSIILSSIILSTVLLIILGFLFFKTNIFEQLFNFDPHYTRIIKTSRLLLSAIFEEVWFV
ncbi:hypothetical protein C6P40_005374 [Pichia californica]|uniref:Uncharacterized protein n=1 Tax=Pichia californica TaxID=460514 RepID=A0A9P7BGI2_9ASCO|nr:hypothetical protein C6P42_002464 [[Candida] californica]KAG0689240.1 hypothetical protein C6P40_005374 [[Candida] californica]